MMLGFNGVGVYAISDATPAIVREGFSVIAGESVPISTTSHVWAMMKDTANGTAYVAPITAASGGSGGGGITSITAGTTPTTGFAAGQLLMSDGAKTQAVKPDTAYVNWGSASVPVYMGGSAASTGNLTITSAGGPYGAYGLGINFPDTGTAGININDGAGPTGYVGFTFSNNYTYNAAEAGIMGVSPGVLAVRTPANRANALRVYNTYTDASNGEWGAMDWQTTPNVLTIGTQANGTGTARNLKLVSGATNIADYGITNGGSLTIGVGAYSAFIIPTIASNWNLGSSAVPWNIIVGNTFQSSGTAPTITGCTAGTKVGGPTAGTFQLGAACAAAATIVFTGMPNVANGYACDATNRTVPAMLAQQTASTTTGFTLTVAGTSGASGNVVGWKCIGY
jgi:hypothetical protein